MKLIVGLGNPGREYNNTRHNVGFMILDRYLGKIKWKTRFEAYTYETTIDNEEVIFIKPITYMNLSGLAVAKIKKYYKIDEKDILIIHDDLDLPVGKYKLKKKSSSGGHNGIKSIIKELSSDEFGRLKIGIGKSDKIPVDKYVLSKLSTQEKKEILNNYNIFENIINDFIKCDIDYVISHYN